MIHETTVFINISRNKTTFTTNFQQTQHISVESSSSAFSSVSVFPWLFIYADNHMIKLGSFDEEIKLISCVNVILFKRSWNDSTYILNIVSSTTGFSFNYMWYQTNLSYINLLKRSQYLLQFYSFCEWLVRTSCFEQILQFLLFLKTSTYIHQCACYW